MAKATKRSSIRPKDIQYFPPIVKSISPDEIENVPSQIKISGSRFSKKSILRFAYLNDKFLKTDLKPMKNSSNQLSVQVPDSWLKSLARVRNPPGSKIGDIDPSKHKQLNSAASFSVRVINGKQVSNIRSMNIKRPGLSLSTPSNEYSVQPGGKVKIRLSISKKDWKRSIPIKVTANNHTHLNISSSHPIMQIEGIGGSAVIEDDVSDTEVEISVADYVPEGRYKLLFSSQSGGGDSPPISLPVLARPPPDVIVGPTRYPPRPSNSRIVGVTDTTISLEWMDNSTNEDGFRLYRFPRPGAPASIVATIGPHSGIGTVGHTDGSLSPNTAYCYAISAYNNFGESFIWDGVVCATTASPPPPTVPSNFMITNRTQNSISMSWTDNATNEDGYDLWYRSPSGDWYLAASFPPNSGTGPMSYTHTGLAPNTSYCYQVEVYNAYGFNNAPEVCATTLAPAPPPPPPPPPPSASDLAVTSIWTEPGSPLSSYTPFVLYYYVYNSGNAAAGSHMDVVERDGGLQRENININFTTPSYSNYNGYVPYPNGLLAGSYYWYVYVDPYGQTNDNNRYNNINYLGVDVW